MRVSVCAAVLAVVAETALGAAWTCPGAKPGHPTASERAAFVEEVSGFALEAEKKHGVPATALVALAAIESSYGWTRLALEANNLFAWRAGPVEARTRETYVPVCRRGKKSKEHFAVFASRAEAFEVIGAKLATLKGYREYTDRYRAARKRGEPLERAVTDWVTGIAKRYSTDPRVFTQKMIRVMNDPEQLGETSPNRSLYRLSHSVALQ